MSISRFKHLIGVLQFCFTGDVHIFELYRIYIMGIGYHIHLALVFNDVAQFVTDVYDEIKWYFTLLKTRFLALFCLDTWQCLLTLMLTHVDRTTHVYNFKCQRQILMSIEFDS